MCLEKEVLFQSNFQFIFRVSFDFCSIGLDYFWFRVDLIFEPFPFDLIFQNKRLRSKRSSVVICLLQKRKKKIRVLLATKKLIPRHFVQPMIHLEDGLRSRHNFLFDHSWEFFSHFSWTFWKFHLFSKQKKIIDLQKFKWIFKNTMNQKNPQNCFL